MAWGTSYYTGKIIIAEAAVLNIYVYIHTFSQLLNFEYPPSDLQNDAADADVHEFIFTKAAISGRTRFPSIGLLCRTHRSPQGAGFGGDTSYQVMLGAPREYNLTHALAST